MPREIQTAVQVANCALRILQMPEIESFDEDSTPARTVKMYYDLALRKCIGAYKWQFSQNQSELEQLATAELPQWKFSYKLPPDMIALIWLRCGTENGPGWNNLQNYEIVAGNVVCTNANAPLFCRYQYEAPVAAMPNYFLDYLIQELAEELAPVFGYNVVGQKILSDRVRDSFGKMNMAILTEVRQLGSQKPMPMGKLAMGRNW
ncbi:MAG: hypothetical protein LBT98_03420 [Puniceicoccales bacterium]|jgi:hypothetical protein|nr:hypothetical protein [Puniceicoccales bacterium]